MTLQRLYFISHMFIAAVPATIVVLTGGSLSTFMCIVLATTVLVWAQSAWWSRRVRRGFELIEMALESGKLPDGDSEFHCVAKALQSHVQTWIDAAAEGERQVREIEAVLLTVDRRASGRPAVRGNAAGQLRKLLSSLGRSAENVLAQVAASNLGADQISQVISENVRQQQDAALVAVGQASHLSEDLTLTENATSQTESLINALLDDSHAVNERVGEVQDGLDEVRNELAAVVSRMRRLHEHSGEIATLAAKSREISARTDMLALNASIESVRAGELGRGFSVVADEIRKLSCHVSAAASDILERTSAIERETCDIDTQLAKKLTCLDDTLCPVLASHSQSLSALHSSISRCSDNMHSLSQTVQRQIRVASLLSATLDQISEQSATAQVNADDARRSNSNFTTRLVELAHAIEPLLFSNDGEHATQESVSERLTEARATGTHDMHKHAVLEPV